jgi:hypothetical protein
MENNMKYLYNIIDKATGKLEYEGLRSGEVADLLKINVKVVSTRAQSGSGTKKKLIIPIIQTDTEEQHSRYIFNEDGKKISLPLKLEEEWDKECKRLNPQRMVS